MVSGLESVLMNFQKIMIKMNKAEIKNKVIDIHKEIISELKEKIEMVHSMTDIDELDVIDKEDSSHQYESKEMEELVKSQLSKEEDSLALLNSIDFGAKTTCVPGAIIKTKDFNFIIGISTMPFDFQGSHFVGISVNSPIYDALTKAKTGEDFSFRDNSYIIESIY